MGADVIEQRKPAFVMALPACHRSPIGDNAIRRAVAISDHYRPVIISDGFPERVPHAIQEIQVRPPNFHWLHRFCHVPNELGFAWAVRRALADLHTERIAFLLCHGYTLAWSTGRWFRRFSGVPFGMLMHGHIFERPKGTYDSRITAFYKAIAPICYREADLLFPLSSAQAELAVKAGAAQDRIVVAPNGFDVDDIGLDPADAAAKLDTFAPRSPFKFLFVGRLSIEKGADVMLQACARLHRRGLKCHLSTTGGGPEASRLRALQNELGLDDETCKLLGPTHRSALGRYYLAHDLLFVPSLGEPFGNVVLEGMAGG